jgi:integrase
VKRILCVTSEGPRGPACIRFSREPVASAEPSEAQDEVVVDYDASGGVVGIELVSLGPVADELLSVLREHKAKQNAERLRLGPAYVDQDLVFCNGDGSPWSPDTFSKQFAGIMRFVGIKGFRFHDVRHASSVKEVSTLLGHSSPMLTLSTYAHVMEGMGREAVNGLARSLLVPPKVA